MLSGELLDFAQVVGEHEAQPRGGAQGRARPQRGQDADVQLPAARPRTRRRSPPPRELLEDTGVAAYKGQAAAIKSTAVLERRAGRSTPSRRATPRGSATINGDPPAPAAFDKALTMKQVLTAVTKTKFIVG